MKALLLIVIVLCGAIGSVVAQKKKTIVGDLVIGELTGKDEATRQITVKYPGKEASEIFSGILVDSSKLKMGEDNRRNLMLSEIPLGMHIRVFYKTDKKINKISRLEVLGEDEFFRLRRQLKLALSTGIAHAENGDDLPAVSPLKVYLAVPYNDAHQQLVEWIEKWNRKTGDAHGKLEIVSTLEHADTLIVVAPGADTMVMVFPVLASDGSRDIEGAYSQATSYLVVKDAGRLKVLWTRVVPVFSSPNEAFAYKSAELVSREMEKRMKARDRNSRK